ncbi:MAG: monofunctional biosynthetic peptidoglycan transglycosylase, partial [Burkholderiaceae bacterium]|nr:monofunctional biosynthetic peptidoglycan transglycosylase [Burkholderiaceae bacterium]
MKRIKLFLRQYLWWIVLSPILAVLLLQAYYFAQIWWWVDHNPTSTSFMRQ